MPTVWDRVKQLEGRRLQTLFQGKEFKVASVGERWLVVTPSTGKGRRVARRWIEEVAARGLDEDGLRPGRLSREFHFDRSLSYLAAIVHAITRAPR